MMLLVPSIIWSFYLSIFHSLGWCDGDWNENMQLIVAVCLAITYKFLDVLIHLPFGYVETFKIKKKHGFSQATCCSFLVERLGMLLEFIILPLPGILLFSKVVQWTGNYISIFFLFATGIFKLIVLYLHPYVIMPIFASYNELPNDIELRHKIE